MRNAYRSGIMILALIKRLYNNKYQMTLKNYLKRKIWKINNSKMLLTMLHIVNMFLKIIPMLFLKLPMYKIQQINKSQSSNHNRTHKLMKKKNKKKIINHKKIIYMIWNKIQLMKKN